MNRKMNRWWKVMIVLLLAMSLFSTWNQVASLQRFASKGQRFTAQDGQELCERVATLEMHSIGFQRSGIAQPPCNYASESPR